MYACRYNIHLWSPSSPAFSVLVLVEGQGQFTQPPSDNHDLPLDSYKAESSFIVPCAYIEVGAISINYAWAKDGVAFQPETSTVGNTRQAILTVPNGDYNSSVEGTYTCSVTVDRAPRGSRNTTVSLPGKCQIMLHVDAYVPLTMYTVKCFNIVYTFL